MYLNCKTYFSFLYGTYGTEELVKTAADHGIKTLALTNINNTCDTWDFVDYCKEHNIKPVAGAEIRNGDYLCYLLLAKNNQGFRRINRFISGHLHQKKTFPLQPPADQDVIVIYPFRGALPETLLTNEYIGIQITEVNQLFGLSCKHLEKKLLVRHPVTFQNQAGYNIHRLLQAIDKNLILSKQDHSTLAGKHEKFEKTHLLFKAFEQYPYILTNTLQLLDQCSVDLEFHSDKTKKIYSASRTDDRVLLQKLALGGMIRRYGANNQEARDRVLKELKIIDQLDFNAYFLITWDIIRYAQSQGFFYIGRGSGANSIVAYCLQITDVDPIELDLYFERFLNPYRSAPPDFDIDFSHRDRDEMIDYIFKRYGRDHVCLLGSYVTFQENAVVRELGKVFGLPKEEIDRLDRHAVPADKIHKQILHYGSLIKNFPRHLSVHAGGILISEEPLYTYTATELPPKGFSTSQVDMFIAEKVGLYKLDILSQRGLGHIKETLEIVRANKGVFTNIHEVEKFKKDPQVAARIREADTIGCFYIESPGMRQLLKKLRCDDYLTLVAASSIIRPGVSQSGMMKQYIQRFHHPDQFEYLHPKMKELLQETYGVMVYQEDVIKVAHHFAGLDMGEADVLRRAMSGKYRSKKAFEDIRAKYFLNCKNFGYPDDIAAEVWRQMESFGGYSFSKAHSASFAVESYQSLFLKTYFPMEFMVAVINNFGGFYSRELYFHELKRTGAQLHLPCVNNSTFFTSITGADVYIGFIHIKDLREGLVTRILEERTSGPFLHLQDFIERTSPGLEQLNILIRIGAFSFTGKTKKELLWEANFLQKNNSRHGKGSLPFPEKPIAFNLPALHQHPLDDAMDEWELLGFPVCNVFELVEDDPSQYTSARDLSGFLGKEIEVLGYLVTSKPVHTIKGQTMFFHTFIDADGDWLDAVFFPEAAGRYPLQGRGFYHMKGKVIEEFGVYTVDVHLCRKRGLKSREQPANLIKD